MVYPKNGSLPEMNRVNGARWENNFSLFCLGVLIIVLPIAHTESIRFFALAIPFGLWILRLIWERRWTFPKTPADFPILLFTLAAALSLITAVDFRYSLEEFIGDWLLGVLLFYLAARTVHAGNLPYFLGALLLGNILMVFYGIFDFFQRGGVFFDYQVRAGSLHSGFGTFSTYLIILLPYLFFAIFFVQKGKYRLSLFGLLVLNLLALFITHTRGAWVAAVLFLVGAGWGFLPRKIFVSFLSLGAAGFLFFASQGGLMHYAPLTDSSGTPTGTLETGQARWEVTRFSLTKIMEKPFQMLGYGRRSFVKEYESFHRQYKGALLQHAHNTFLNVALQTGVHGLALFLYMIFSLLRRIYPREKNRGDSMGRFFLLATFWMIITFFVRNQWDDFFIDDLALLFWFLCGSAIALERGRRNG